MTVHEVLFSILLLALTLAILVLLVRLHGKVEQTDEYDSDQLSTAISKSWQEMGFEQSIGQLEQHAGEVKQLHNNLEDMLKQPQTRGEFGEEQLRVILEDHLPPEMFGIRKRVVDGKTPDAHIKSSAGLICIDSKFPLDNYQAYVDAESEEERTVYKRQFRTDVENHLEKIATDYVRPESGTTDFALAFIPSEGVYYHLVREEYDLLREYTNAGVQVVSPLTIGHKLQLIKAGVHAQKLSEKADEVQQQLNTLSSRFATLRGEWDTLYTHIDNAKSKSDDVEQDYAALEAEFDRIDRLSPE